MDKDVLKILGYFASINPSKQKKIKALILNNKRLFSAISGLLVGTVLTFFSEQQFAAWCFVWGSLGIFILHGLSSVFTTFTAIYDYKNEALACLESQYDEDLKHIVVLSEYQVSSLERTQELFESQIDFINKRVGFIVGSIDKLGIIPAVFMMYVTYRDILVESSQSELHIMIASFVVGVYIGAIFSREKIDYLESRLNLIRLTLRRKSSESSCSNRNYRVHMTAINLKNN